MVNLKKIGVIAASALFVGATLGTASAVTFSSDMLVKNNVAVAKIVTGTKNPDATGLTADEASAKVISDKVSATFKVTTGAGITFEYVSQDIDDDFWGTEDDDYSNPAGEDVDTNRTWELSWLISDNVGNATFGPGLGAPNAALANNTEDIGLRYDATGDGDVKDSDDYPYYNDIYIEEWSINDITIKPVMRVGSGSTLENKVFKLKGQEYLVTDFSTTKDEIELVPVVKRTLVETTEPGQLIDSAV
ncbi:MAG: hypothetical protein ACE5PM_09485, partial [Candidatus Hydrothermarchaeales archaeon]